MSNYPHSTCPMQGGVMFTPWGPVSAGTVIAGIAAGLVPQSVPGEMLAAAFPRSKYYTARRNPGLAADTMGSIDNKWAATFSGQSHGHATQITQPVFEPGTATPRHPSTCLAA